MIGLTTTAALALCLGAGGDARWAVRYDPGLMGRVAAKRGLPVTECMFAHPTLPIGTRARIEGVRTGHSEVCTQADTSEDVDRARHIRTKRIELSYAASFRICGAQWSGAAVECPVRVSLIE